MAIRYEERSYLLRQLIYEVRNKLKAGWSEEVYHQALVHALQEKSIPVISKPRRSLSHQGIEIHTFEPDIIVWDSIILELKTLEYAARFSSKHYAQLLHYLKFYNKRLGMLVNFSPARVNIKRLVWDEPELDILEDYEKIIPLLSESDKVIMRQIRQSILTTAKTLGLGFMETIYRDVIAIEIGQMNLTYATEIDIPVKWNGEILTYHKVRLILVANQYLVLIRSFLDFPSKFDFRSLNTYLDALDLRFGLLVNFGRKQLQIFGIKTN